MGQVRTAMAEFNQYVAKSAPGEGRTMEGLVEQADALYGVISSKESPLSMTATVLAALREAEARCSSNRHSNSVRGERV